MSSDCGFHILVIFGHVALSFLRAIVWCVSLESFVYGVLSQFLHYRELALRSSAKKPAVETIVDNLREVETESAAYRNMLEASLIARHLIDLRIAEGDQFFLYLRNLPEKVAKHCQLIIFCHFLSSLEVLSTHGQGWEEAGLAKLWFSHV